MMKQSNIKLIINNVLFDCVADHENGKIREFAVLEDVAGLKVPNFAGYLIESNYECIMWQIAGEL